MNILMIVHAYYLKDARVRRYAEYLAAQNHAVDVLCLRESKEEKDREIHRQVRIFRIGVARRRGGPVRYIIEYADSLMKFFWKATVALLDSKRYDIVHVHNFPNILVFVAVVQKLCGAKIILDIHDPMPELFRSKFPWGRNALLLKGLFLEERISWKFSHAVITANHLFKDVLALRGCPSPKISVVMNSPDPSFFVPSVKKKFQKERGEFLILYIGTIARRYGISTVLDSIIELNKDRSLPRITFVVIPKIIDEGEDQAGLLARVRALKLESQFRLLAPVPNERMPEIIASADLSIYTPGPDIHMDMALSLKIPEAIACRVPVVASRLSVLTKYFDGECLFFCEPGDVDDCARKIREVMESPGKVKRYTHNALEKLSRFSWELQKTVYAKVIASLT